MKKIILLSIALLLLSKKKAHQWSKPTKREAIGYACLSVSGVANGFNQAIEHYRYGIEKPYIDITKSFKRKYKNYVAGDFNEAYFESKIFLAWTTDVFHLSNTIDKTFLTEGIVLNTWDLKSELKQYKRKTGGK